MTKFLHTADWHIRDSDFNEVEKCLEYILKLAYRERPDLIIHSGDIFDSRNIKLDSMSARLAFRVFSELADLAPVCAVLGTPSHEGEATEALQFINAKYPIWVSKKPEQIYLLDGCFSQTPWPEPCEIVISLVPQPSKRFFSTDSDIKGSDAEIASAMSGIFGGFGAKAAEHNAPHILIGHFQVGGAMISETQILTGVDVEISKDQIALANASLTALGHIHKSQELGNNIFYSGSITGLTYGELDPKGFYIHQLDDKKLTESRFELTPARKLAQIKEDLTSESAVDNIYDVLSGLMPDPETIENSILRVELKIYQDQTEKLDRETIEGFYLEHGAKEVELRIIRIPRENVRSERILKLTTLREKLIEMGRLKDEVVAESILAKADALESEAGSEIIAGIAAL